MQFPVIAAAAVPFSEMSISRLTSSGKITHAAISPGGRYAAHVTQDAEGDSLWVRHVAAPSSLQIAGPAATEYISGAFAPDGDSILRVRIVDITATNAPPAGGGQADLRVLSSATQTVSITGGGSVTVQGLTLEQPPTQGRGGGLNSSLAAGTITLGTPLANGANININLLLGVALNGNFRIFINVEALP